ncbi:ScbR family autoregulator-binding transcription factor [Prescottella soli]|uniref:ScbR family autoregulator-binding transcription factor n=1 Tax=Prescottella soli TaxID=1543852 RepID=A0ABW9FRZ1_9NOCA
MVRQERAEVTRDSVLRGGADVFARLGYAQSSLSEIVSESKVTKGALYFHFASKEELARAVVDAGCDRLAAAVGPWLERRTPALEALIGMSGVVADISSSDVVVRSMLRLVTEIGDYRGSGNPLFEDWLLVFDRLAKRASAEGDLRDEIDPDDVGRLLLELVGGVHVVAAGTGELDRMAVRLGHVWHVMLPVLVPEPKVEYFREFAARRLR